MQEVRTAHGAKGRDILTKNHEPTEVRVKLFVQVPETLCKAARLKLPLEEVMRASSVPGAAMRSSCQHAAHKLPKFSGGLLHFNGEPSWLAEKGDQEPSRNDPP